MKNQYFGDVKDYLKYGLLRSIGASGLDLGVVWLLTRDDGSSNGTDRKYLERPEWRDHDPELYDFLQVACAKASGRTVANFEGSGLLSARYFNEVIPELEVAREGAFERAGEKLAGSHLLFFDPDIGVETKSTPYGARGSSRYVYWRELEAAWENGTSLLIYQHFPRQEHEVFAARIADELRSHTAGSSIYTVATPDVLFLVAAQPEHVANIEYGLSLFDDRFRERASVAKIEAPQPESPPPLEAPPVVQPPRFHVNVFWSAEDGCWIASIPDLLGCAAAGDTPERALSEALAAQTLWLESARQNNRPIPAPSYNGPKTS